MLFLSFLPVSSVLIGSSYLLLAITNSWGIEAKFRPLLDVTYHGLMSAMPFLMGYTLYQKPDETCLLLFFTIFTGGVLSELMRGIKDYDFYKSLTKNTVVILGVYRTQALSAVILVFWMTLISIAVDRLFFFPIMIFNRQIPIQVVTLPIISFYLEVPIIQGLFDKDKISSTRVRFRRRALVIITILAFSSLMIFGYGVRKTYYGEFSWKSSIIALDARTVIAGPESWGVAFITFNYIDDSTHYYILLHRDGVLELTKVIDSDKIFLSFVDTNLSPFNWHSFKIIINNDYINVYIDEIPFLQVNEPLDNKGRVVLSGINSARLALFKNIGVKNS
jgi:hypothetical protein